MHVWFHLFHIVSCIPADKLKKLQNVYKIIYHFEPNQQQILFHHSFQPQLEQIVQSAL